MFKIIRIDKLIRRISYFTVLLSLGIFLCLKYWDDSISLFKLTTISSLVSMAIVFLLVSSFCSRIIWNLIRKLNKSLYPDLNGAWAGTITTDSGLTIPVRCVIRQRLLETEIDMHGETMKSVTLESTPIINSGQKKLYYTYRSTPKNPAYGDYYGCTLFDVREYIENGKMQLELSGKYYTDRKTIGRITIKQIGSDTNHDVSFY
jgi:hypothetical protein